jgi:Arc/MetJ-type ribon-helix-helix transcriptional regulator
MVTARMPAPLIKSVDSWAAKNADGSRSEAIRRLVELGLAGSAPTKRTSPKEAAKASDMAGRQIDKLANPAMPEAERRARKRRLIKGPREFRDLRGDQPKPKG